MMAIEKGGNGALCVGYPDNYQLRLKRREVIKYFRAEFSNCSTHGLTYVVNDKIHLFERVFWTLSYLSCVCTVFLLLSSQLFRFYETPTVMSVEKDYFDWNVSYPAFTVCPSFKPDTESLAAFVNETNNRLGRNLEPYIWAIVQAGLDTLDLIGNISSDVSMLIDPKEYASIAALTFRTIDTSAITTNTNWPVRVQPVMTELGMCHVINSNVAYLDDPLLWGSMPRPYVKSNIVLSVHDRDFFTQVNNYAEKYKVFIHSPDKTILSSSLYSQYSDKGFLQLGVEVWITKVSDVLKRFPRRFRKCRFINENISERYPVYSYPHCMLECRIKMIIRLCGCIPHFYKPLPREKICHIEELKCVLKYKKEILTLSATPRTLQIFQNSKDIPAHPSGCGCLSSCETDVYKKDFETFLQQSYLNRLRVGISSFPKVRVVRDIIFNLEDIIQIVEVYLIIKGDFKIYHHAYCKRSVKVGGAVNLCIGASIISVVEFFMTFIRMPIYRLAKAIKSALRFKGAH